MKPGWLWVTVALTPLGMALAQSASEMEQRIQACTQLPITERVGCLEKISADTAMAFPSTERPRPATMPEPAPFQAGGSKTAAIGSSVSESPTSNASTAKSPTPPVSAMPPSDKWVVSETTSPVDYAPVAIAIASSNDAKWGLPMTLTIQCRGGRTELVIGGNSFKVRPDNYLVSYSINDGQMTGLGETSLSPKGLVVKKDIVPLLHSLPGEDRLSRCRPGGPDVGGTLWPRRPQESRATSSPAVQVARIA
jgi:hypothetical protein